MNPKWEWRAIVPIAILVVTSVIMIAPLIWGRELLGDDRQALVRELLADFRTSPIAPFAVMAVFTLLGLTGFPQFLLIGGVAAIFGSWLGFAYAWLATMVSATLGFYLGRASGGTLLRRYGGPKIKRTSEILGERGVFASFIVRLIPSGPAVVVNMIAGISHIRVWQFLVGTGLGIVPKTVLFAFFGGSIARLLASGNLWELTAAAIALGVWIAVGIWVRRRYLNRREQDKKQRDDEDPPPKE